MDLDIEGHDVDALFDSLDNDGGGSLDTQELITAIKQLTTHVEQRKVEIRKLSLKLVDAVKAMKASQDEWKKKQKEAEMNDGQSQSAEVEAVVVA